MHSSATQSKRREWDAKSVKCTYTHTQCGFEENPNNYELCCYNLFIVMDLSDCAFHFGPERCFVIYERQLSTIHPLESCAKGTHERYHRVAKLCCFHWNEGFTYSQTIEFDWDWTNGIYASKMTFIVFWRCRMDSYVNIIKRKGMSHKCGDKATARKSERRR